MLFRAGLNLSVMMRSGIYNHSKWSEYMFTSHKRCISLKSHSRVNNLHRVTISGRHSTYAPVILPNTSPLWVHSVNLPASCRCISTTGMFFYFPNDLPNGKGNGNNNNKGNGNSNNKGNGNGNGNGNDNDNSNGNGSDFNSSLQDILIALSKKANPLINILIITSSMLVLICVGIGVEAALLWQENQTKVDNVDKAIKEGSVSNPISINSPVDQKNVIKKVVSCFIDKKDADNGKTTFGFIFGRIGTGKTQVVMEACNRQQGVLYCEITSMNDVTKSLAKASGMWTESTLIGTLVGGLITSFPIAGFYKVRALTVFDVIDEIAKSSEKLKKELRRPACLFIDGVEIIAKNDQKLLLRLVDLAKEKANNGSLRIILVSSESLPLIEKKLQRARWNMGEVMEINDIEHGQAVSFLTCGREGLPNELAEDIVKAVGPRLIFCQDAKQKYSEMKNATDSEAFKDIIKFLQSKFVSHAADAFIMGKPATAQVIQALHESEKAKDQFDPRAFLGTCSDEKERAKLKGAMDELVEAHVLWYSQDSTLEWDNKLVREDILKYSTG